MWCRAWRAALATGCAMVVLATCWLVGWHRQDACGRDFGGLLVGACLFGSAVAALVAASRIASSGEVGAVAPARLWGLGEEVIVLLSCWLAVPILCTLLVLLVAVLEGTSWVAPYWWWNSSPTHGATRALVMAALWSWAFIPWAYGLSGMLISVRGGSWWSAGTMLVLVPIVARGSSDALLEPFLADLQVPVTWCVVPSLGLVVGIAVRLVGPDPWRLAGIAAAAAVLLALAV